MRIIKSAAAAAAVLLVPTALALAAETPSGVYSGTLKYNDGYHNVTFAIKATFKGGNLTRLFGQGQETPFVKKLSNTTFCGAANYYDSADQADKGKYRAKITGSTDRKGNFSFVLRISDFHQTVYLKGKDVSSGKLSAKVRFYQDHMPGSKQGGSHGHCDSGFLPVTLTR